MKFSLIVVVLAVGAHAAGAQDAKPETPPKTVLKGHIGGVTSLVFLANGTLVSGSRDETVRLDQPQ